MKRIILLGTDHDIQRGKKGPSAFLALLERTFAETRFESIAEEIDGDSKYLAESFCNKNGLVYISIEPMPEERARLGILSAGQIVSQVIDEFRDEHPEISVWPRNPNGSHLPAEVWARYTELVVAQHRAREVVWLEKILEMATGPCLCIIGANHYSHFLRLLIQSRIDILELSSDWEPN